MILYHFPGSCSLASHIGLEEAGAAFTPQLVNLALPDEVAAYRAINPKGTVPAFTDEGEIFTENVAILTYVARSLPAAKLLPEDTLQLALCYSAMVWFSSTVHISRRMSRAPHRYTQDETIKAAISAIGHPAFWANLEKIDAMLAGKTWLMGDQYTAADGYALLFYDWGTRDGYDMASLQNFTAFKNRMLTRPAVQRALAREKSVLLPQ